MNKTIAYLRASTDKQDIQNQKFEILEYANRHDLRVNEWVAITISSRRTPKQRRIEELLDSLAGADTLIVTELSRLGRSTAEVIDLINQLMRRQVRLIVIKQNLDLNHGQHDMSAKIITTIFSLLAELERDLISLRTKEALAAKRANGVSSENHAARSKKVSLINSVSRLRNCCGWECLCGGLPTSIWG